jgi:hypothetical protein
MNIFEEILSKIENMTVTVEDFDALINDSVASSVQERIRRRTQVNATKSHIDRDGHQPLRTPTFDSRVKPKRKPKNKQNHGRGKLGRKHSSKTIQAMHEDKKEPEAKADTLYFEKAKNISELIKDKNIILDLIEHRLIDSNFAYAILKELDKNPEPDSKKEHE